MGDMNCKIGDLINGNTIKERTDYDKNNERKQYDHPKNSGKMSRKNDKT